MKKVEEVYFKVQAEFVCNLARDRYWSEGISLEKSISFLTESFSGLTEDIAKEILTGKKILAGLYPDEEITLEDDNKYEEYREHLKYIKIKERIIEPKDLTAYDEFILALQNELPSYYFPFELHTDDNSTISYKPREFFDNLERENYKLLGICKEPEYRKLDRIGLLIEDQQTFEQFWYHGPDWSTYRFIIDEIKGEL